MSDLTGVSLFAGVGGIDLALERAGVTVTAAVEIDQAARGVLADRFPHTTLFPDVTKVTADDLRATGFVPERGILTAGWPCQGNSVAGARGGMADPRSGLWRHVVRLLADLRPRWFFGENVPGLLSVTEGEDFGICLQDLADLGMGFAYRVMDAQHFGVPQRRRRVFIVGCLGDSGAAPIQVLLEPKGGGGHPPQGLAPGQGVAATLTAGIARAGVSAPGRRQEDDVNLVPMPALTARYGKGAPSDADDAMVVSTLQGGGFAATGSTPSRQRADTSSSRGVVMALTSSGVGTCGPDDNQAQAGHLVATHTFQKVIRSGERDVNGDLPPEVWAEREVAATLNLNDLGSESRAVELVVGTLTKNAGRFNAEDAAGGHLVPSTVTGALTHALTSEGADASEDGTGRGTPIVFSHTAGIDQQASTSTSTSPTMKAGHDTMPSVQTDTTVRRLTPLECERLQGFPDGWTETSNGKAQADGPRYRQMGNAVAVPCVEWIARRIVAMDGAA